MDINILAGKCSRLTLEKVFSLLKERDKTKKHIILAPDRSLFSIELRLFEELQESCFFDVNVMSITRFSKLILNNLASKKVLTKQSGVALVKKLLIANQQDLKVFKKATNFMGFANSLFETICLYKSCNVSPQDVFVSDSDNYSNLKQKDIRLIYSKYEEFLQKDFTDSFNQLKLFADHIDSEFCKDTIFYFVEYDDFTDIMYDIIYKLSKHSDATYIACTYSKDACNSNISLNKVYYDLIDLFKFHGVNYKINKLDDYVSGDKAKMLDNLLAYNPNKCEQNSDTIAISTYNTAEEEIKGVLADIYYKVSQSSDLNFSDFCVILPNLKASIDNLKQELRHYQIPFYIDQSELILDNILIRTLFQIINIIIGKFERGDFTNLLKSTLLNFDIEKVLEYDNFLKRIDAKGKMCFRYEGELTEDICTFVNMLSSFSASTANSDSVENYLNNLILPIYEYLKNKLETYASTLDIFESRIISQVCNKFESVIQDINQVFGNTHFQIEEFIETFKAYFEAIKISLPPITSNTLFVADFQDSYISTYKYIYILGCNENKLPKFSLDNGLVTDEEISKLPNGKKLSPTIAMINKRKTFKLFDTMFKYNQAINLSYCLTSKEGKLYPNNLIVSLLKIFKLPVKDGSIIQNMIDLSFNQLNIDNIVRNNQTKQVIETNVVKLLNDWETYENNINYRRILTTLANFCNSDTFNKYLFNNQLKSRDIKIKNIDMFRNNVTSVSQIETYYSCPYKHFARYGLRINKMRNAALESVDIGNIIHLVLKNIMPFAMSNIDSIQKVQEQAKLILDKVLAQDEYSLQAENLQNKYVIKALYRELDRICVGILRELQVSAYSPNLKHLEYAFNPNNLQLEGIKIRGLIDRVDILDGGFIIIDYKTGNSSFDNYNDVLSGKKLQLLVYAKVFELETNKKCNGAFYFPINNGFTKENAVYKLNGIMEKSSSNIINLDSNLGLPNTKSQVFNLATKADGELKKTNTSNYLCISRDDFDYVLNFAVEQVRKAIINIKAGDITPMPLKDGQHLTCEFCEYKGLCNYMQDKVREINQMSSIEELKTGGEN